MKISPSQILTFVLAVSTALSMPVYPTIVLGGGNFDTQLIKSRELNISTGTNSVHLEERQGQVVALIVMDVAAAVMTAIQTFVLLFNDDAVSSNLMLLVL